MSEFHYYLSTSSMHFFPPPSMVLRNHNFMQIARHVNNKWHKRTCYDRIYKQTINLFGCSKGQKPGNHTALLPLLYAYRINVLRAFFPAHNAFAKTAASNQRQTEQKRFRLSVIYHVSTHAIRGKIVTVSKCANFCLPSRFFAVIIHCAQFVVGCVYIIL